MAPLNEGMSFHPSQSFFVFSGTRRVSVQHCDGSGVLGNPLFTSLRVFRPLNFIGGFLLLRISMQMLIVIFSLSAKNFSLAYVFSSI